MARTLLQIQKEMQKLEKEAEQVKAHEVAGVVQRIKTAIDFYELKASDLFGSKPKVAVPGKRGPRVQVKAKKSPSPARYRDKETGKTWTGHGMRPGWFRRAVEGGIKPEDMAI